MYTTYYFGLKKNLKGDFSRSSEMCHREGLVSRVSLHALTQTHFSHCLNSSTTTHSARDQLMLFYGTLSVSSASTRQDWSLSRTRNGGWYSNAERMPEPRLWCFCCRNQMTTEIPMMVTTLSITRADTSAFGSEDKRQSK